MMNKTPAILVIIVVAALAVLILMRPGTDAATPTGAASANSILVQAPGRVSAGETFSVTVNANDLSAGLYGIDLSLGYDSAKVAFVGVSEGTFLSNNGADQTLSFDTAIDTSTAGVVSNYIVLKLGGSGSSGSGTIATYQFRAIGSGKTSFGITSMDAADQNAQPIALTTQAASVTIR